MAIPIYGSITRPENVDEAINELKNNLLEWKGNDIEITYHTDEFTSVCPTTGQPDFNKIYITYRPDKFYIESKAMKFYMWSFREHGIHCEYLADKIATDIKQAIKCNYIKVEVHQKARGGLALKAILEL